MSFNGNLEHFPLVDVIQLLHMTSKTGILYLKSQKGESQLVFHKGYLVSANHLNNSIRIGKILIESNSITEEQLEQALKEQKAAGTARKPLVATLLELGIIDKTIAFKGLETLIELTIVEVLTWESGTFSLDVSKEYISDEYRYFPEKLQQELLLNAQGVLMDALRIYDEKMRDGTLSNLFFTDNSEVNKVSVDNPSDNQGITADLLGLDELDDVSRNIPDVFKGLKDQDFFSEHRDFVTKALPEYGKDKQELLVSFLAGISKAPEKSDASRETTIILFSRNELLSHSIKTVCVKENLFIFVTDEANGLDLIIEQSLGKDLHPVLIIDIPHDSDGKEAVSLVRLKIAEFPGISVLIAACCDTWYSISMEAMGAGARSVIPRPCLNCHEDSYIAQMISFLTGLGVFLKNILPVPQPEVGRKFEQSLNQLKKLTEPPEIALILLNFAAVQFERAITFVVSKSELIAEKSIGVISSKSEGAKTSSMFRIPLDQQTVFKDAVENGRPYYGHRIDNTMSNVLYKEIGFPRNPKIMIVPLISRGKVIALTYADFGTKPVYPPQTSLLEALAQYAGAVLDNALYRNKIGTIA